MSIKKKQPVYETSDGREFLHEEEAEKHERLVQSIKELEYAAKEFTAAAAAVQKTADNYPFKLGYLEDYFVVKENYGRPYVQQVWIGYNKSRIEIGGNGLPEVRTINGNDVQKYRLNQLFKYRGNADKEAVEQAKEWIKMAASWVEEQENDSR